MTTRDNLIAARDRAADLVQFQNSPHVQAWFQEEMLAAFQAFTGADPTKVDSQMLMVLQAKAQAVQWLQSRLARAIRLGQDADEKLSEELANEQ